MLAPAAAWPEDTALKDMLKEIAPNAKDFTGKRASMNYPVADADKECNRRK